MYILAPSRRRAIAALRPRHAALGSRAWALLNRCKQVVYCFVLSRSGTFDMSSEPLELLRLAAGSTRDSSCMISCPQPIKNYLRQSIKSAPRSYPRPTRHSHYHQRQCHPRCADAFGVLKPLPCVPRGNRHRLQHSRCTGYAKHFAFAPEHSAQPRQSEPALGRRADGRRPCYPTKWESTSDASRFTSHSPCSRTIAI